MVQKSKNLKGKLIFRSDQPNPRGGLVKQALNRISDPRICSQLLLAGLRLFSRQPLQLFLHGP